MKFYHITPIELYSPSRRWLTDEIGLKVVENMYVNYPKGFNKWPEFKHKVVRKIWIDFGGIMSMDEPEITIKLGLNKLSMKVHHLPLLIDSLNTEQYVKEEPGFGRIWSFGLFPRVGTSFHQTTRDAILAKAEILLDNCEEMIEGANRDFDQKIRQVNEKSGKIVVYAPPRLKRNPHD
jgi:hypothetical protein